MFRRFVVYKRHPRPLRSRRTWEYSSRRIKRAYLRELNTDNKTKSEHIRPLETALTIGTHQGVLNLISVTIGLWVYFSYGGSSSTVTLLCFLLHDVSTRVSLFNLNISSYGSGRFYINTNELSRNLLI